MQPHEQIAPAIQVAIARVREEVAALGERTGRVSAPVALSARVPGADLFVITPRSLAPDTVAPESTILCDLEGRAVASTPGSDGTPSGDPAVHARLYRGDTGVGGIAHRLDAGSPLSAATAAEALAGLLTGATAGSPSFPGTDARRGTERTAHLHN